ncbi:hypothetical protein NF867_14010 [Solitalea sp. MAHUQ-68]|uniref:DUF922 domain-containing protein n=1 Tax=Solitalea agri TaxID=2953739 RepID=A0A9X2F463_9SPHI|nr:hypothetical protein [Solitalea agri]MCO4293976.1 hypothetical protein [Solitalea agri]
MNRIQLLLVSIWLLSIVTKTTFAQDKYVLKIVEIVKPYSNASDTIYHTTSTSLKWKDFAANPNENFPFAAMTNSGFGYKWSSLSDENRTVITVIISTYFIKSKSWVKANAKGAYELSHEQLHFDITKRQSEHFKNQLASLSLDENYAQSIHQLYLKYYAELKALQTQYDEETDHGLRKDEQALWQRKFNSIN